MSKRIQLSIVVVGFSLFGIAQLSLTQQKGPRTIGSEVEARLNSAERELLQIGEAMPEDKYGFRPTTGNFEGVRTFAGQLKHVGAYSYILCSGIKQDKLPIDGEDGPEQVKT